jgi:DNA-(apurinic or apyrimidinic site) lyase
MFISEPRIREDRVQLVVEALKSVVEHLELLVSKDPQFVAIRSLVDSIDGDAAIPIVLNALISYRLGIRGEEYWLRFSEFFRIRDSKPLDSKFEEFLRSVRSTWGLEQKINRVRKALTSSVIKSLSRDPYVYCSDLEELVKSLSKHLGVEESSKTMVFTAKMYGYFCIASGRKVDFSGIDMPVDYRNALLAITSCLVEIEACRDVSDCAKMLTSGKASSIVRKAWGEVCDLLKTPCLLLDTFTWLFTGVAINAHFDSVEVAREFKAKYGIDIPMSAVKTLLECVSRHV